MDWTRIKKERECIPWGRIQSSPIADKQRQESQQNLRDMLKLYNYEEVLTSNWEVTCIMHWCAA